MRQYVESDKITLKKVVCNQCGRELKLEKGIVQEGVFSGKARWGYFSGKNGETDSFDLGKAFFNCMARGFAVPVTIEEEMELL